MKFKKRLIILYTSIIFISTICAYYVHSLCDINPLKAAVVISYSIIISQILGRFISHLNKCDDIEEEENYRGFYK